MTEEATIEPSRWALGLKTTLKDLSFKNYHENMEIKVDLEALIAAEVEKQLTEDRIRAIVREELSAWEHGKVQGLRDYTGGRTV